MQRTCTIGIVGVLLTFPAIALAQDPTRITISVTYAGAPSPDVTVYHVGPNDVLDLLGKTGAGGSFVFDRPILRTFGTRVNFAAKVCSSKPMTLVFGEQPEAAVRKAARPAFDPFGPADRCVIRGGYGIYYDRTILDIPERGFIRGLGMADIFAGVKTAKYSNFAEGFNRILSELAGLNYNSVGGAVDDSSTGVMLGAGIGRQFTPDVGLRLGLQYERLGQVTSNPTGNRTNVAGSASNVAFTSDTDLNVSLFNLEVGATFRFRGFTVSPNLVPGFATVDSTTTSVLRGAPVGPTPATTIVNTTTVSTDTTSFGLGWNVRLITPRYRLGGALGNAMLGGFAQFQSRTVGGVFSLPNEGRLSTDIRTRGIVAGATLAWER